MFVNVVLLASLTTTDCGEEKCKAADVKNLFLSMVAVEIQFIAFGVR